MAMTSKPTAPVVLRTKAFRLARVSRLAQVSQARRRSRGAAVFIVVLVVVLLSALGLFAVRSAGLTNQAAGYNRQMTQTHYIADYAIYAMVASLQNQEKAHADAMQGNFSQSPDQGCVAYSKLIRPTCARYSYQWLQKRVQQHNSKEFLVLQTVGKNAGSFGPGRLEADMRFELTDLHDNFPVPAGYQANSSNLKHQMITISAEAQVRPQQLTPGKWDTAAATAAGVEQVRAHVIIGPIAQ